MTCITLSLIEFLAWRKWKKDNDQSPRSAPEIARSLLHRPISCRRSRCTGRSAVVSILTRSFLRHISENNEFVHHTTITATLVLFTSQRNAHPPVADLNQRNELMQASDLTTCTSKTRTRACSSIFRRQQTNDKQLDRCGHVGFRRSNLFVHDIDKGDTCCIGLAHVVSIHG